MVNELNRPQNGDNAALSEVSWSLRETLQNSWYLSVLKQ